jgi:putative transposase
MFYNRESHRVYSLIYHLIFVVKYRQNVFVDDIGIINELKEKFKDICDSNDVELIEIECGIDHVYILISAKPTLDITKFINSIKGHSSRYLRKKFKDFLKDKLWGDHFWSPSYFIATTGNVSIDTLKKYIEDQRKIPNDQD